MKYCDSDLFADDTTIYTHSSDTNIIETKLQNDFHAAITWCLQNKMQINYDKTTCMTIGTRKMVDNSNVLTLQLNNTCIAKVKKQKLLGIYIDENLTLTAHIDYLYTLMKISLGLHILTTYVRSSLQKFFSDNYQPTFRSIFKDCFTKGISFLCLTMVTLHGDPHLAQTLIDY